MVIRDIGSGWCVWAHWFGEERTVFSSDPAEDPLRQLAQCQEYIRQSNESEA